MQEVVLAMLAKEPSHGYELRSLLREVCGGMNVPVTSRDFGMAWMTKPDAQALAMASGRAGVVSAEPPAERCARRRCPALGATPRQGRSALVAAQVIPAIPGAITGVPLGILLLDAASGHTTWPPAWWLAGTVAATLAAVAAITLIPAWLGTRHSAASILQAEMA